MQTTKLLEMHIAQSIDMGDNGAIAWEFPKLTKHAERESAKEQCSIYWMQSSGMTSTS